MIGLNEVGDQRVVDQPPHVAKARAGMIGDLAGGYLLIPQPGGQWVRSVFSCATDGHVNRHGRVIRYRSPGDVKF